MTDEDVTVESITFVESTRGHAAAWAIICDQYLDALPSYGVSLAAYGRALDDVPAAALLVVAKSIVTDPDVDRLPTPGVFRRHIVEMIAGRPARADEVFGLCVRYAQRRGAPARDDLAPVDLPDGAIDVMEGMGSWRMFADPTDILRSQFRDAWRARQLDTLRAATAPGALAGPLAQLDVRRLELGR